MSAVDRAQARRRGASWIGQPAAQPPPRFGLQPLVELVAIVGAPELQIASQLIELGLATGVADVAERLGCTIRVQPDER